MGDTDGESATEAGMPRMGDSSPRFVHSPGFADILSTLRATLVVSTYQAGKLLLIRERQGRISMLIRSFEKPMGVAANRDRILVGTRNQIWTLRNVPDIAGQLSAAVPHDACFLPRSSHVTGDISVHEIALVADHPWIVNTRFSCLCTIHPDFSFVPRWRPPFVTSLAAEDRCHLNGLAVVEGQARYVTALGATDAPEGWRRGKAHGGALIDVASGEVVASGLSMPHSPRVRDGNIWLLDSGTGRVLIVDSRTGRGDAVAALPGYARGLAFLGRYAFVGMSRVRETSTFGDLPITERMKDLKCGIAIIDASKGIVVEFLEFESGIEELFDVQMLPGIRFPTVTGFQKEMIQGAYVIPGEPTGGR
jgi:uncharacterized protein (TIGR03032 family)